MVDRFVTKLEPEIRAEYPDKTYALTPELLQEQLRTLVAEAADFQLATAGPVTRYIVYRLDYGDEFPRASDWEWALQLLEREDLSEHEKIARIDSNIVGGPIL